MLHNDLVPLLMEHYQRDVHVSGLVDISGSPLLKLSYALDEMKEWTEVTRYTHPRILAYERVGYIRLEPNNNISIASMLSIGADAHVMSISTQFPEMNVKELPQKAMEFFTTSGVLEEYVVSHLIPDDEPDYPKLPEILLVTKVK